MKKFLYLGVAALTSIANSAQATVNDVDSWAAAANRQVHYAMPDPGVVDCGQGIVVVRFQRSPEGRAVNAEIVSGANSRALNWATRRTLSRLHNLPPLPAGVPDTQKLRMMLVFGEGMTNAGRSAFYKADAAVRADAKAANTQFASRLASGEQLASNTISPR